jgi:hypothetical protein
MSPFEALYGQLCHTPLSWFESGERVIFGPDIVTEAKANTSKYPSRPIASKELRRQETQSLGI